MIIVGQAPGPNTDPAQPLSGPSGRKLASLCGMTLDEFLTRFERVNLLADYPGRCGKGDAFPAAFAKQAALDIRELVASRDVVMMLGLGVARAFNLRRPEFFKWTRLSRDCGHVVVVPHPSGISHWWNEPRNVTRAAKFWRALAEGFGP